MKTKRILFSLIILSIIGNLFFLRKNFYKGNKDPWKEIAIQLKEKDAVIVLTEHNRYLNYYMSKYEMQEAQPISTINSDITGPFWFLETGYDQRRLMNEGILEIKDSIQFHNKFTLYEVQKTN